MKKFNWNQQLLQIIKLLDLRSKYVYLQSIVYDPQTRFLEKLYRLYQAAIYRYLSAPES